MRPLLPLLPLLLLSCAHPRPFPRVVPVRVECGDVAAHGWARVVGDDQAETVAHVVRCPDGRPRGAMVAGGVPVELERYEGERVILRAQGAPWRGARAAPARQLRRGDSGSTLYDGAGRPVCLVDAAIDSGYVRCVELPGWTVEMEPPSSGLTMEDLEADGCWPGCGQWRTP